jgi:aspartyl-tRNA(Asn)/glutamyl-tRNA(Gln) amidotransferase subunit C
MPSASHPPSQALSADAVRKVARLSRLALTDQQVEAYRGQLSAVLVYMERLKGLDLSGVEPMSHPIDATNRLDEDVPGPTLPTSALMAMAPDALPPFIKVPKVLGEGAGA